MRKEFKFALDGKVKLRLSGEAGEIVGRAEFSDQDNMYQVVYLDGNGCQKRDWIMENELIHDER